MSKNSSFADMDCKRSSTEVKTIEYADEVTISKNKKIRSCDIGQRREGSTEKVIMIVGESGVGKTTIVNFMFNYILGVLFNDDVRYSLDLDNEEKSLHQGYLEGSTKWITTYTLNDRFGNRLSYNVSIVDTPGFTSGSDEKNVLNEQFLTYFNDKLEKGGHLDAVVFVVKATTARLTTDQNSIFKSILDIFGKDIEENIILFLTHATAHTNPVVLRAISDAKVPYVNFYKFNNSSLFESEIDIEDETSYEESERVKEMYWNMGCKSLKTFFSLLESMTPKSIRLSAQILSYRTKLDESLQTISKLINEIAVQNNMLQEQEKLFDKHNKLMDINKDFQTEKQEWFEDKVELPNRQTAMNCNYCKKTCHFPCDHYLTILCSTCSVMRWLSVLRGCSVCTLACSPRWHSIEGFKYQRQRVSRVEINEYKKDRYDKAKTIKEGAEKQINVINNKLRYFQQKETKCLAEVKEYLEYLNGNALRPCSPAITDLLQLLIKKERIPPERGWTGGIHEMRRLFELE